MDRGAWLAKLVELETLDLGVGRSRPTLDAEITCERNKEREKERERKRERKEGKEGRKEGKERKKYSLFYTGLFFLIKSSILPTLLTQQSLH